MSQDARAFFLSKKAEIDDLYVNYQQKLARQMYDGGDLDGPVVVRLTARQRVRVLWWRVRRALAAPFAWAVKVLDPSRLAPEDY